MAIQEFDSNTEIKKELPQSGEIIYMNALEGWDEASEEQKGYLSVYFHTYPKKIRACMESGIGTGKYNRWKQNDQNFINLMKLIEFIHLEELKDLDYAESYTDSKTRARFLKAMESGGYGTKKEETNNTMNINVSTMKEAEEFLKNMD